MLDLQARSKRKQSIGFNAEKLEARDGIEPTIKVLQTFALPLGDRAGGKRCYVFARVEEKAARNETGSAEAGEREASAAQHVALALPLQRSLKLLRLRLALRRQKVRNV